ncbi:hypothetical protein STCU_10294 [Strigomonas culicis]|uniref:Uncharacterized protein n=1 Tax=Strigomonas culicis TaxID=28005 RepID=S9UTS2_9TRYP|nr:hypothetical protein STCU_10294 [Strigomonas culicis]|eukprot:EPY17951.1 hypothetical protein STCU_10294 [Strigomonas culicis]
MSGALSRSWRHHQTGRTGRRMAVRAAPRERSGRRTTPRRCSRASRRSTSTTSRPSSSTRKPWRRSRGRAALRPPRPARRARAS